MVYGREGICAPCLDEFNPRLVQSIDHVVIHRSVPPCHDSAAGVRFSKLAKEKSTASGI